MSKVYNVIAAPLWLPENLKLSEYYNSNAFATMREKWKMQPKDILIPLKYPLFKNSADL